jgi:hypothetical protein
VAYNVNAHGAGAPVQVFFTGQPVGDDALVEDPRLGGPAFCQGMAETAAVCAVASVQ